MPQVETVPLGFETLADLDDGRIAKLLKMHLARLSGDCIDRPGDKAKRKVVLEFIVQPILEPDGHCDAAKVELECKSKLPTYRSKPYEMRVTKGGFLFNRDFPDALDQPSLYDDREEES